MATLREYCEKLSTSQLQALLREECEGRGALPIETIMTICEILAARNPNLPSVKQSILNMCRIYLEEQKIIERRKPRCLPLWGRWHGASRDGRG